MERLLVKRILVSVIAFVASLGVLLGQAHGLATAADAPAAATKDRVIVIGLDGTRPDYIMRLIDSGKLPNLAELTQAGMAGTILPPLPPPSPVSWATFETGMNPGKHGIFGFFNIPSGTYTMQARGFASSSKAIWEYLSAVGKTGIVVNLFRMAPAAPIKGIVIPGMGTPSTMAPYRVLSITEREGNVTPFVLRPAEGWDSLPQSFSPPLEAEMGGDTPGYLLLLDTVDEGISAYDQVLFSPVKTASAARVKLEQGRPSSVIDTTTAGGKAGLFCLVLLENTVEAADFGELSVYKYPARKPMPSGVGWIACPLTRTFVPDMLYLTTI